MQAAVATPKLEELMAAFTQVASGVEDAHRVLVSRVEALLSARTQGEHQSRQPSAPPAPPAPPGPPAAALALVPPCDGVITLEDIERQAVLATLERCGGHRQRTAAALGIGVRTLGMKLKAWKDAGLVPTDA